jgi:hypothetical protein
VRRITWPLSLISDHGFPRAASRSRKANREWTPMIFIRVDSRAFAVEKSDNPMWINPWSRIFSEKQDFCM